MVRASEVLETTRLILRRPRAADAEPIFARYASDPDATRFMSFPRHRDVEEARQFLAASDAQWAAWPAGPYLIESRAGVLLGATGFDFEDALTAQTGYVLARDAWGHGYATEALQALTAVAPTLGLRRLYATVHPEHHASIRVLEKCGFAREPRRRLIVLPNLGPEPVEAVVFARRF
jgi:ribosomal-protein-alanine N-acetyltransferase